MAIMIPDLPREYTPQSLEGDMFNALKRLPDDYYVIHSFRNVYVKDNVLHEGEADFVVFNQKYGLLCIEAKAGRVKYQKGSWQYASGKAMKHGGPYNQAAQNKWNLLTRIQTSALKDLQYRCKLLHAVWFPSITRNDLSANLFPPECDKHITMTMEDLENPLNHIISIFEIELENGLKTNLSNNDTKRLLREIICPEFDIFPSSSFDVDIKNITFNRLLDEQKELLNYLTEQRSAVINGAAGTGKTMLAVEKASRHANDGDRVLFLCYNVFLQEHLQRRYPHNNIDYMTIDGFACKVCHTSKADYKMTSDVVMDMYLSGTFPYRHVIVDEGQDFGRDELEESELLQSIQDIVVDNDGIDGTFYVFYDRLQLVQAYSIPRYISEADCRLTLYKNCRNTENIALTSLKPISERAPKLYEGAVKGIPATMHFCDGASYIPQSIAQIITDLEADGISDIVILTCATEDNSNLLGLIENGKYKNKLFTTCRKFKGLEADAIILIDINESTFRKDNVLRYYVGASRARIRLEMVSNMDDKACTNILKEVLGFTKKIKKPKRELAYALNALPQIESYD